MPVVALSRVPSGPGTEQALQCITQAVPKEKNALFLLLWHMLALLGSGNHNNKLPFERARAEGCQQR